MRSNRLIEQLSGSGLLGEEGGQARKVKYAIRIHQEFYDEVPGLKTIEGLVMGIGPDALLGMFRREIVLTLQDGRKLKVVMTDSNGSFLGNGPIYS